MVYNVYANGVFQEQFLNKEDACNFALTLIYDCPSAEITIKGFSL